MCCVRNHVLVLVFSRFFELCGTMWNYMGHVSRWLSVEEGLCNKIMFYDRV